MTRTALASLLLVAALPAAAQQAVPAANFTDMWFNPNESGWGINFTQHAATNKAFVVWYTYDPREAEVSTAETTDFKPLWVVLPDSNWITPTTMTGTVYVTNGTPFAQPWNTANNGVQSVGTFTFSFSDANNGTFTYNISPPGGLAAGNPAFGLPAYTGTKTITRQPF